MRDPHSAQASSPPSAGGATFTQSSRQLGALLCWAVVFADIGTSIYYVPGILYGTVGPLTGLFVLGTMLIFLLLALKYVEVIYRFPQGGGVVTVAAHALTPWWGALGGMLILVDYFLTAAISCLSGVLYLSLIVPALGAAPQLFGADVDVSVATWLALAILFALGILNWLGLGVSAAVSLVAACIALLSDGAILVTVFAHVSLDTVLTLLIGMFGDVALTPVLVVVGFAGSFLAFSGLESISQLAPDMKLPRRTVGRAAMALVVVTVGLTTPLLALFATLLLPTSAADPVRSTQLISLLAGRWGDVSLQTLVALSAGVLLLFAANTAIIGAYHVVLALARLDFLPGALLRRNRWRRTPQYAIALATLVPILALLLVSGNIATLGAMYAFGLLGAFALTSLGMDIVRLRERRDLRRGLDPDREVADMATRTSDPPEPLSAWARSRINLALGFLTTVLVILAWAINLVAKPLATAFGGAVVIVGIALAVLVHLRRKRQGRSRVMASGVETGYVTQALAVLGGTDITQNEAVIRAALAHAAGGSVVFLYLGDQRALEPAGVFRLTEAHLHDPYARSILERAQYLARAARTKARFIYRHPDPDAVSAVWRVLRPAEVIVAQDWQDAVRAIPAARLIVLPDDRLKSTLGGHASN
jgi:amino acid transporter